MPFTLSADAAEPALRFALLLLAKATLLLGAAALGALALSRASAAARHLLWSLALLALLALPALALAVPAWKPAFLAVVPASRSTQIDDVAPQIASPVARFASLASAPLATSAPSTEGAPLGMILLAAWAAGVIVLLARLGLGLLAVRRLARGAQLLDDREWAPLAERLSAAAGVRRRVRILLSPHATMPVTWGMLSPVVLLPTEALDWDEGRRRAVLLHELAHVARHDCLTQALAQACRALYWVHPGAWWAERRMRVEREQACDDRVLEGGARASDYAGHLLGVARAFRAPALAGAAAAMARPTQLEGRVRAVLDAGRSRRAVPVRTGAICATAAFVALLPLAAASPSEREGGARTAAGDAPAPRKKLSLVVPIHSQADASGVARGRASVETRVEDVDIRLDLDLHVTLAQQAEPPAAAARPRASEQAWRRPGPSDPVQMRTVSASPRDLGEMGDPARDAVSELIRASRDRASMVRRSAVRALGGIDDESVVQPLIASLRDEDPTVRSEAARALGGIASRFMAAAAADPETADMPVGRVAREATADACLQNKRIPTRPASPAAMALRSAARDDGRVRHTLKGADVRVVDTTLRMLDQLAAAVDSADRLQQRASLGGGGGFVNTEEWERGVSRWSPRP